VAGARQREPHHALDPARALLDGVPRHQWRAVAQWSEREGERWGLELDPNPSFFQPESNERKFVLSLGQFALLEGEEASDQRPVDSVNWQEAMEFCHRLSQRTGRVYTLPSEAQWEYACRAGSTGKYCFGDNVDQLEKYAWYDKNSNIQTHPVGEKLANGWGLHDMHGNVFEWCEDVWHNSYNSAPSDGSAWLTGGEQNKRSARGGSWINDDFSCHSAVRVRHFAVNRKDFYGFRVVV